jgi:hypothetical protein
LQTVARFDEASSAYIAKALLENEGIPAHIADEHLVGAYWIYANAVGGIKLQVAEADVERSRDLLAEDRSSQLLAPEFASQGDDPPARPSRRRQWLVASGVALWAFLWFVTR